jgi:hypothetical protein
LLVYPIRGLDPSRNRRILRLGGKVRKILIGRRTVVLVGMMYRNETETYWSVKDEFGSFEEMKIPDSHDPIWIIGSTRILVIRSNHQFGELASDFAILTSSWGTHLR